MDIYIQKVKNALINKVRSDTNKQLMKKKHLDIKENN
jgi:hypothetical protein